MPLQEKELSFYSITACGKRSSRKVAKPQRFAKQAAATEILL
jgi:hypothetical protein